MRIPSWGPKYRVSLEIFINSFTPAEEGKEDRDKFLMVGGRMPFIGLYREKLICQAKFAWNSNRTDVSFKPEKGTWIKIEASQFVDNNEVQIGFEPFNKDDLPSISLR